MAIEVGITGIGLVTPLGQSIQEVLTRLTESESAAKPTPFKRHRFDCPVYAPVTEFDPEAHFPDDKTLRFMNLDAQMAVVAAKRALTDARLRVDKTYPAHLIALYGSTGVTTMTIRDIERIIRFGADDKGRLDLQRFGKLGLHRIRPVLSFKILANMPICFVSIAHQIKGPNAVYTPWEGHGAQALIAGIQAIRRDQVPCALVGGCDVSTRELSFINCQQLGLFESWKQQGHGCIPGEGSAFLVLENMALAQQRGQKVYATLQDYQVRSARSAEDVPAIRTHIVSQLTAKDPIAMIVASGDQDTRDGQVPSIAPKPQLGNLFAAAAATQLAIAAQLAKDLPQHRIMANCFGPGTEQASFVVEGL